MNEKEFRELLIRDELNVSGIANKMYPNNKSAKAYLGSKLANRKTGHSTQKLTETDLTKAWGVLKDLADDINNKAPAK